MDELDISGFLSGDSRAGAPVAAVVSVLSVSLLAALVVTFNIGFDFGLGLDFAGSLAVAGVLSLTSLGVLAKVLIDEGKLRTPIGIEMFTMALIAELLVLLVVGFSVGEHAARPTPAGLLRLAGQIAGFVVVTWLLASRVIPPLIVLLRRLLPGSAALLRRDPGASCSWWWWAPRRSASTVRSVRCSSARRFPGCPIRSGANSSPGCGAPPTGSSSRSSSARRGSI